MSKSTLIIDFQVHRLRHLRHRMTTYCRSGILIYSTIEVRAHSEMT